MAVKRFDSQPQIKMNFKQELQPYKLPIVGGLSFVGFSSLLYSLRYNQTQNLMHIQESLNKSRHHARFSAHLLATKAFGYATGLVGLAGIMVGTGLCAYLGVDNLHDFTIALRQESHRLFPSLRVSQPKDYQDTGAQDFLKEWNEQLAQDETAPYQQNPVHAFIGHTVKSSLGLDK